MIKSEKRKQLADVVRRMLKKEIDIHEASGIAVDLLDQIEEEEYENVGGGSEQDVSPTSAGGASGDAYVHRDYPRRKGSDRLH